MLKKLSAALALCGLLGAGAAQAQSNAPIHLVIAFPTGGPTDFVGRTISEEFGKQMKRTVIIDNKPGANGNIAGEYVAHSTPDGNTLFFSSVGSIVINPSLYPKMPYDVPRDFQPVALIVNNATI
ncbi:MAG TPA: tripartite tricarboxylate transporter substrate-binding protein, partial [Burkholderiales bacterium]|nr:tripartite tricarboxylate transporter substrate-binding protein [Burkholderiales bacterium]